MSNRNGQISVENGEAAITFERKLAFPITAVWSALTDPAQRAKWFGRTTLEARKGGLLEMTAEGPPAPEDMRMMSGRILTWDPPHVFEHEWHQGIIGHTTVRYELVPDGAGCILKFKHSGFKMKDAEGYIPGEHAFLDRMEAALKGEPLPSWQQRYNETAPSYGVKWSR